MNMSSIIEKKEKKNVEDENRTNNNNHVTEFCMASQKEKNDES